MVSLFLAIGLGSFLGIICFWAVLILIGFWDPKKVDLSVLTIGALYGGFTGLVTFWAKRADIN